MLCAFLSQKIMGALHIYFRFMSASQKNLQWSSVCFFNLLSRNWQCCHAFGQLIIPFGFCKSTKCFFLQTKSKGVNEMKILSALIQVFPQINAGYIKRFSVSGNVSGLPDNLYSPSELFESFLEWSQRFRFFHVHRHKLDASGKFWYVISALETRKYYSALHRVRGNAALSAVPAPFVNLVRKAG